MIQILYFCKTMSEQLFDVAYLDVFTFQMLQLFELYISMFILVITFRFLIYLQDCFCLHEDKISNIALGPFWSYNVTKKFDIIMQEFNILRIVMIIFCSFVCLCFVLIFDHDIYCIYTVHGIEVVEIGVWWTMLFPSSPDSSTGK